MRTTPTVALAALLLSGTALAVPPDQPPLDIIAQTPNYNYVLRTGQPGSQHKMPTSIMLGMANALDRNGTPSLGNPLGYHVGYTNRGFRAPYFTGGNDIVSWACANNPGGFDCDNGFATGDQVIIPTDVYKTKSESCIRGILGHELFHHVEFGYTFDGGGSGCGGTFGTTACEGQARALQDKIYFDLDLDPSASCVATFRSQVNGYLDSPDRTIWSTSYSGALFWTYLMEQYGTYPFEPSRGIDFLVTWWQLAQARVGDPDVYEITQDAIQSYDPEQTVLSTYHDFIVANTMKSHDLSSVSASFRNRYSYRDEEPVPLFDNQMQFHAAALSGAVVVPGNGTPAGIAVTAKRFGGKYYDFDTSQCASGHLLEFSAAPTPLLTPGPNTQVIVPDAMLALVTSHAGPNGGRPGTLYKYRAHGWQQTIPQPANPYQHVTAVVAGWHTQYSGVLTMRCAPPPPLPFAAQVSSAHPVLTGAPGSDSVAELLLRLPRAATPGAAGVSGQPTESFALRYGSVATTPTRALPDGDGYRVLFTPPALAAGTHDVDVGVAANATSVPDGVNVAAFRSDAILAVDASASMASGGLDAVRSAARGLTLGLPSSARLGLVRFAGNGVEPDNDASVVVPAAPLGAAQRNALAAALDAMAPASGTGVVLEDVLVSSIAELDAHGAGGERHLVLVSDGGDGATSAATLVDLARNAGLRVHTLALGPRADQPLLARLARETGGDYRYVDADAAAGVDRPALESALRDFSDRIARRQKLKDGDATVPASAALDVLIDVDPANDGAAGSPHVKVFSGRTLDQFNGVHLFRPDGTEVVAGPDVEIVNDGRRFTYFVGSANGGVWKLRVDPGASGRPLPFSYRAAIVDPRRQIRLGFTRANDTTTALDHFRRGDTIGLHAAVLDLGAGPKPASVYALVKTGTGTLVLNLHDDGQDGDDHAGDGIYQRYLRRSVDSAATGFPDNEAAPGARGSYAVHVVATWGGAAGGSTLEADGAFAVLDDATDADGDGQPDRYEAAHACLSSAVSDAGGDADGDGATNAAELAAGSDPCNVDSDDGGETDGSEIAHGQNPLAPADDGVARIRDVEFVHQEGEHEDVPPLPAQSHTLRFGTDPRYATVRVRRAPAPSGPWIDLESVAAATAHGRYVDRAVVAGTTYCYQLVGQGANGRVAAASDTLCEVARMDPTAPRGSVVIDDGAPRTSNPLLALHLELDNETAATSQMRVRCPGGVDSGWIAFAPNTTCNASMLTPPAVASVAVTFRDAAGNESTEYADDIDYVAASARGRIHGRVRADTPGTPPLADAALVPDHPNEPAAFSAADGSFDFPDLASGTYTFSVERAGYVTRNVTATVGAGGDVDLGTVLLETDLIFRNGFQ